MHLRSYDIVEDVLIISLFGIALLQTVEVRVKFEVSVDPEFPLALEDVPDERLAVPVNDLVLLDGAMENGITNPWINLSRSAGEGNRLSAVSSQELLTLEGGLACGQASAYRLRYEIRAQRDSLARSAPLR